MRAAAAAAASSAGDPGCLLASSPGTLPTSSRGLAARLQEPSALLPSLAGPKARGTAVACPGPCGKGPGVPCRAPGVLGAWRPSLASQGELRPRVPGWERAAGRLCLWDQEMPQDPRSPARTPPSEEDSAEAERLKTEGNEQMKVENFEAAVHFYGKAIELNPANAVYFCNRAAAYSKLGNYAGAVQDCERAICIDPAYSKAYGRMGLALSSLNKHVEAVAYYKKALELDPDNETYKSNLKIAELKLREAPSPTGGAGSIDIAGLLNNPGFMTMASSLMNNPQIQQLMSGMISGGHNPLGTPGTSPSQNDLASLIQAGQQFAQQMQQQNPELIEQLRSQIRSRTPSASNDEQQE
uniref:Small glutamine rich tetratricopeptide repeat co-chaperone alpha n=1 Tax=Callithrix jacchus TaxID=9483 RepID=F7H696_CALJA